MVTCLFLLLVQVVVVVGLRQDSLAADLFVACSGHLEDIRLHVLHIRVAADESCQRDLRDVLDLFFAEGSRVVEVLEPEAVSVLDPVVFLSQDAQRGGPVEGSVHWCLQRQASDQVQVLEVVPVDGLQPVHGVVGLALLFEVVERVDGLQATEHSIVQVRRQPMVSATVHVQRQKVLAVLVRWVREQEPSDLLAVDCVLVLHVVVGGTHDERTHGVRLGLAEVVERVQVIRDA
uniref:Putative secreted protein n=1 Tax=Rhipicephalus microplus TaxID=6941 RepID=A0A6M2D8T6_RHIMP